MSIFNPNKTVSNTTLPCNGRTTVTLSFNAVPELNASPADIALVMDRSNSLSGNKIADAKVAAKLLIQTVAKASGSAAGTEILNGTRLGLISFSNTATTDVAITNNVADLNAAVDALNPSGSTNHKAAFEAAEAMLSTSQASRRIVIMFTDGVTTAGGNATPTALNIKGQGMEIYCISLGAAQAQLEDWASDPIQDHIAHAADETELNEAFGEIAAEVVKAGALDMVITEVLNPDFQIVHTNTPTHGTVDVINAQTLEWKADAVGVNGEESAVLTFEIMYIGAVGGEKAVNQSITYTDRQAGTLTFPDPKVTVSCDGQAIIIPEPCPIPAEFDVESCKDAAIVAANDTAISGLGRIVQVDVLVKNVCPQKRVAVAILLSEIDDQGQEYPRGMKTILIPPQTGQDCQDIQLQCVSFVVPEVLDVSGNTTSICNARKFSASVLANYVDTDYVCCDSQTVTV